MNRQHGMCIATLAAALFSFGCGGGAGSDRANAAQRASEASVVPATSNAAEEMTRDSAARASAAPARAAMAPRRQQHRDEQPPEPNGGIPGIIEAEATREVARSSDRAASRTVGVGESPRFQRPEDAPLAPMGMELTPSALVNSPGYTPPSDPEADAVRRGRRDVEPIDTPFTGGAPSPEALARKVLAALEAGDMDGLQALRVTGDEFAQILWPEFPQSRPITNNRVGDVYFFLDRRCHSGISTGLSDWGGEKLELRGLTYEVGRAPYTNFTLYDGVRIHVRRANGEEAVLKFVGTLAERKGVWKIYAYSDRSA